VTLKRDRYFSGPTGGPHRPLPDEIAPSTKARLRLLGVALALLGVGVLLGIWCAPETPRELKKQLAALQATVAERDVRIGELEQAQHMSASALAPGKLRAADRTHLEREGRRYIAGLRRSGAQAAANLMEWFMGRWLQMLDQPQPGDRTGRRAATLSLLVGGMAANVNPGDYVPWQSEFFAGKWLPEVHFDIDGDGLPGSRKTANTHDGFANVSVCHVAMALNLAMTDAQVLVMPELHCDRPDSKMSVFLQGATFDDALNEFIRAVRAQGFLVAERQEKNMRLVLVGARPPPPELD
jgi:hypothetical protein